MCERLGRGDCFVFLFFLLNFPYNVLAGERVQVLVSLCEGGTVPSDKV